MQIRGFISRLESRAIFLLEMEKPKRYLFNFLSILDDYEESLGYEEERKWKSEISNIRGKLNEGIVNKFKMEINNLKEELT